MINKKIKNKFRTVSLEIKITILVVLGILAFSLIRKTVENNLCKNNDTPLTEAMYYSKLSGSTVKCLLCPKYCLLKNKQRGFCNVRVNKGGRLYSLVYGRPIKLRILPINRMSMLLAASEYKILLVSTAGCNMRCKFCLVWPLSQSKPEEIQSVNLAPGEVIDEAIKNNCKAINYTTNEPTVFYEYMLDIAKLAREKGIINILSTSGYINPEPLRNLCRYMDGISLGVKGVSEDFYREYSDGELEPVLTSMKIISEEKVPLEVVYVVIPTLNDDISQITKMANYVKDIVGKDTTFCLNRYKPSFKLENLPLTPMETLLKAQKAVKEIGLKEVYIQEPNIQNPDLDETIYCSRCNKLLLRRRGGVSILVDNIKDGRCKFCGQEIPIISWLGQQDKKNK